MRVVCVHQGYELYGSDRAFLETIGALRRDLSGAQLSAVLPQEGPLAVAIRELGVPVEIEPLWILRRRRLARLLTLGLLRLPAAIVRAARRLRAADLVYVNTGVVADHLIASRLFPSRVLVHVHELPEGAARFVMRALLIWSGAEIVYNSKATHRCLALPGSRPQSVVYNSVAAPDVPPPAPYDGERPLKILQLGRLSHLKGQDVLVRAIALMPASLRDKVEVRIVGESFEDPSGPARLAELAASEGVRERIAVEGFARDPARHFAWADLVVVPSRLPESLGRVAIEAAASGRPVIASAIGGLPEVVADGRTGWLVEPGNPRALAAAIADPDRLAAFGAAGREHYRALFSPAASDRDLLDIVSRKLGGCELPEGVEAAR